MIRASSGFVSASPHAVLTKLGGCAETCAGRAPALMITAQSETTERTAIDDLAECIAGA